MRLRNERLRTGHLLMFVSAQNQRENFSIFIMVKDLAQFEAVLTVTEGFRQIAESLKDGLICKTYSIADVGKLRETVPGIDEGRMLRFEPEEFLSDSGQMNEAIANAILERLIHRDSIIFPHVRTGGMATGANFFDRAEEMERIWQKIQSGENILLQAPRRYGKSSLLHHIAAAQREGWCACYVDVQGGKSPEDLIYLILKGVCQQDRFKECLPARLSRQEPWSCSEMAKDGLFRKERARIRKDWKGYGERLFLSLNGASERIILLLDEVSFLFEDMIAEMGTKLEGVSDLLSWFATIRRQTNHISYVLSGSEHLPVFLDAYGVDGQLQDMALEHLDLFEKASAKDLISLIMAGQGIVISADEIDRILSLMGDPIPYFLQLVLDTLISDCKRDGSLSGERMEEIYYRKLLGPERKRYFESVYQQVERYERYKRGARKGAECLLSELASRDDVPIRDLEALWSAETGSASELDMMLGVLRDDFYVRKESSGFVTMSSKLLRDWWQRHVLAIEPRS